MLKFVATPSVTYLPYKSKCGHITLQKIYIMKINLHQNHTRAFIKLSTCAMAFKRFDAKFQYNICTQSSSEAKPREIFHFPN